MNTIVQKIECPKCGESISIDAVLKHQIEEKIRKEFNEDNRKKDSEIAKQKKELEDQKNKFEEIQKNAQIEFNKKMAEKLAAEKVTLWKQAQIEAQKQKTGEIKFLQEQLLEKDSKLSEANENELQLRKEKNKLEEDKRNFELEKQRQLDEERKQITEEASKKASEEQQNNIAQLNKKLVDALKVNNELRLKLEQGSQQAQGEVLELELENILRSYFPRDAIEPVPKGINGADVIQKVFSNSGHECGSMVWESKYTKSWNEQWIIKLKEDQRKINADIAILVTETLPKDIKNFGYRDGVWIVDQASILGLCMALRMQLIQATMIKLTSVGKNEKMEVLFKYLSGTEFRHKVEALAETFIDMKQDLDQEQRAINRLWSKREKQIQKVVMNTAKMYGDVQGLLGSDMQPITALEVDENLVPIRPDTQNTDNLIGEISKL